MKKVLFIIYCFSFLQGCGQKKEQVTQNPHITANNIVEEISKQVKNYPSEKILGLQYSNDLCYFEMFVDGIRVYKKSNRILSNTAVEINHLLFKSGKHKVTYRMYPMYKVEEYDESLNTLVDETELEIKLYSYDKKNKRADDIYYVEHAVPKIEKKITDYYSEYTFAGSGKTYYEGSFEIDVDVPYNITPPFANAQDLRKMDRKELEKKLLAKYKQVWNIYQNKELDNIARLEYDWMKIYAISNYASKENIETNWKTIYKNYKDTPFEMQPIENYKLEFFADGKLVALMMDTKDNRLRGNTALWAKVKNKKDNLFPVFFNRYFYIPEGETEFKVY